MKLQKSKLLIALLGAAALQLTAVAYADRGAGSTQSGNVIMSRGADAAQADLNRDWAYKGQDQGRALSLRSDEELSADLNRDWSGGKKSTTTRRAPHSRSADSAHDDLMRNWGG